MDQTAWSVELPNVAGLPTRVVSPLLAWQDDGLLPPLIRAKALAALAGIVLLLLLLMAVVHFGARWARRYGDFGAARLKSRRRRTPPPPEDDWARKPLVDVDDGRFDDDEADES